MEAPILANREKIGTSCSPDATTNLVRHRLFVHGLLLPCKIGVHRHELDAPQRVRISVNLDIQRSRVPCQDSIQEVVSYDDVVNGIRKIVQHEHINLVESLAEQIVMFCFQDDRVISVKIKVEKLDVFGNDTTVGVELQQEREA